MSDDINDGMKAWQDATNERMRTWHPAPAAPVPAIQAPNYNEQALSKFLWENCGFVSSSTAAELARQLLGSYRIQPIDCASLPAPAAAPTREEIAKPISFMDAMNMVDRGFDTWKDKPHNAKWYARIDGTPIPNDLKVNIAEAICHYLALNAAPAK